MDDTMLNYELPRLANDDDFERMCADVYSEVYKSRRPQKFGRRGQRQSGIDILIHVNNGLVGVQAKRYNSKRFTRATVEEEVKKLDQSDLSLQELIIATSASSDNRILSWIEKISTDRQRSGLCKVTVEFWEDITAHIRRHQNLSQKYDVRPAPETLRSNQYHEKDVQALRRIFSALNISILEQHIQEFPKFYHFSTAQLYDRFAETYIGIDLIFHDQELKSLIDQFAATWRTAMPQDGKNFYQDTADPRVERFQSTGEQYRFRTYTRASIVFKELEKAIADFSIATREFLSFVSHNFPEIDINELGRPIGTEIAETLRELEGG